MSRVIEGNEWQDIAPTFRGNVLLGAAVTTAGPVVPNVPSGVIIGLFRTVAAENTQESNIMIAEFSLGVRARLNVGNEAHIIKARVADGSKYLVRADTVGDAYSEASSVLWYDYPSVNVDVTIPVPMACVEIWYQRGDNTAVTADIAYPNGSVRVIVPNLSCGLPAGSAKSITPRTRPAAITFKIQP